MWTQCSNKEKDRQIYAHEYVANTHILLLSLKTVKYHKVMDQY